MQSTLEKLKILADGAKFDVSCSSSGVERKNTGKIGSAMAAGICHSWAADGRCISLLKILFTNNCVYDCEYCVNRRSVDVPRASFEPEELARLTIEFYRRNYIEGLFLSSAVVKNPDHTMEMIAKVVRTLRKEHHFNGYIHIKAIPGADNRLISEVGNHVDRMSVNIELPSSKSLKLLAPQKTTDSILQPMRVIKNKIDETLDEDRYFRRKQLFTPAGQSTQLIVGATPENDLGILKLSESRAGCLDTGT
jgi:putative DNA modification/repair radical SAM protein